ncbi:hypothetical protein [Candidatus Spongiihabitans sp.]|uniref:hypothetical protein n=1 Tax=Candidatus Spongiihabitans sp. TaxID=3101308 RepID=UPI003C6FEF77
MNLVDMRCQPRRDCVAHGLGGLAQDCADNGVAGLALLLLCWVEKATMLPQIASSNTMDLHLLVEFKSVELVDGLRNATNSGMAFGSARFKEQVEQLYQRRVKPKKLGPKPQ